MKNAIRKKRTVGRLSVVFALCMILVMPSAVTAIGISLKLDTQMIIPRSQISYSFEFKEPNMQALSVNGADYTTISLQGCVAMGKQAGDPSMPVKMIQLLLPPKKTVSGITVSGTPVSIQLPSIDLKEKPILPQQQSVPIGSDQTPKFTLNSKVYSSDVNYPSTTYSEYTVGYSHGYAILSFSLNPMQYNPVEGTLVYYPKMTVTVSLQNGNANQFYSNNPSDRAYVKTLVSNPDVASLYDVAGIPTFEYPGGLCSPSQHYDYVIITTTQYGLNYWDISGTLHYNWNSLLAQHSGEGLSGTVVTIQDINACTDYQNSIPLFNDQPAHIREFCKDAYQDWGTRYVLIAGDADTIAARQLYYAYEGNVDSDLYWSNLDLNFNADQDSQWGEAGDSGFDLYSEIFIGRVTCDTPQDVSNWLTKDLFYANSNDDTYLDNAAFYGGDTTWNCQGDDFMDYSAIKGTSDWLGPIPDADGPMPTWAGFQFGFETWDAVHSGNQFNISIRWTAEPPNPGWQGGSSSAAITGLKNAINNNQVTILSGIAHANNQMSLDVQASAWESQYTNTKPFFIHDYGCHCGDFNDGDDGVIESMLFKSDTKLAFGCIYNTGYGWGQFDDTNSSSAFETKQFWNYFLNMENISGDYSNWQFGKGHAWAKDSMAPTINWDASSGTWRGVIECCLLFGDPAQMFKTPHPSQSPTQPATPAGSTLVIWNQEYNYISSATDPENDQVYYLFDWADGSNSGWLGPYSSGQTVTGSHIWTVLGTYDVKVRAKDVWGAASIWSEPLSVTVTDNTPPAAPDVSGPQNGTPGNNYLYNMVTTDAQDQNVFYYVDWADGTNSGWLGPYVSGVEIHVTHSWTTDGTYAVKVKAKDILNSESGWTTLNVVMPVDADYNLLPSYNQPLVSNLLHGQLVIS
jgi:Peptidase family C25/Propeptide_C25